MTKDAQQRQEEHPSDTLSTGIESAPLINTIRSGEPTRSSIGPPEIGVSPLSERTEFQWKFAEETHQYVREYIRQADQKAAFFFAGSTALIAFLYNAKLVHRWVKPPTQWSFVDMVSLAATIGLTVCALACLATVFPRLQGSKRGHVFFGAIAEFDSRKDYASDVLQKDVSELMEAKLCHVHDLSGICGRKFYVLKVGQWAGAVGVFATVLLLLMAP